MMDSIDRDLKYMWHPYTQMKDLEKYPPLLIDRASGIRLYDKNGNSYIDAISSWWCNLHGHNHPEIMNAIKEQVDRLDHVLFAGFTHDPAINLAETLVEISPEGLSKVFFSDNGSTSVESALKMSLQFWKNTGYKNKNRFVKLDKGYHGDTFGAMSVGGKSVFTDTFKELLFPAFEIPAPYCYRCPFEKEFGKCSYSCLQEAKKTLEKNSEKISALVLEPLVLGAGGIIVYPPEYLRQIREVTRKLNIHLIVDEVATGFFRTGRLFACDHVAISPDIMCLSKSITSGAMALAATLVTDEIFYGFYDDYENNKTFYHGHTYTANPIACSAANKSLELLNRFNQTERVSVVEAKIRGFLSKIKDTPYVGDVRSLGLIGAMELVKDKSTKQPFAIGERLTFRISREAQRQGLILRPLGDVLYFFLPLCVTDEELDEIFQSTRMAFKEAGALC